MERRPDFGELEITKIERTSLSENREFEMQWTVINYSRVKPNEYHIMRTVIIQNLTCPFVLHKGQSISQSHANLVLSLQHAGPIFNVSFSIIGKNKQRIEPCVTCHHHILRCERNAHFIETPDLTVDDTLTISVTITLSVRGNELLIFESMLKKPTFGNLLENGMFADLEILVGDQTLLAHKAILCARSTVLAAIFENNPKENIDKRFRIDDSNAESVKEMLNYIYTGETGQLNTELALDLLQLADRYDLQGLRFKVDSFLKKNMSISHAMKILTLVDSYNHEDLKDCATQYIGDNLKLAMQHEDWLSFRKHDDLLDIVLQYVSGCILRIQNSSAEEKDSD